MWAVSATVLFRELVTQRRNLVRIAAVRPEADGNDAEALARLFEDPAIRDDDTVRGRLEALLQATEHRWLPIFHTPLDVPGLYEAPGYGDEGFRAELKDPWAASSDQVGHFLTAVALALNPQLVGATRFGFSSRRWVGAPADMPDAEVALRLAIGHEKRADPGRFDPLILLKLRRQFASTTDADVVAFHHALGALATADLDVAEAVRRLSAIAVGDEAGNSSADLLLSLLGYRLAQLVREGAFADRSQVATWIRENVLANPPD